MTNANRTTTAGRILRGAAPWLAGLGVAMAACAAGAAPLTQVVIDDTAVFPESLTSTAAGDLIIGSSGKGTIYRAAPGADKAVVWIDPKTSGMSGVLGVFADEKAHTLYVCSAAFGAPPEKADGLSALRAFDLATGAARAAYPMPGGAKALCNDIAVAKDGTAYVSETLGGRVLRLRKGASALEVWAKDDRLAGADGVAIGSDGAVYLNTVSTGRLFRIPVEAGGASGAVAELQPSLKLNRPDGLRAIGGLRFLMAEGGAGRIDEVVVEGDRATIVPLKSDDPGVTAVTLTQGRGWFINAKFAYRSDPALKGKSPEPFTVDALDVPK